MKTLVIHPTDPSTTMLEHVYKGKDFTVINAPNMSKKELRQAIQAHDRIILLGHGLQGGLLNPVKANRAKSTMDFSDIYMIDDSYADLLKTKETISVWCYSNHYFARHQMKGFHTGMIISERLEANLMLGHCPLSEKGLYENMVQFSKIIGECIDKTPHEMKDYILAHYQATDAITQFNRKNILVL